MSKEGLYYFVGYNWYNLIASNNEKFLTWIKLY